MLEVFRNGYYKVCFDSGNYECQVSTTPHISRIIHLAVQGKSADIQLLTSRLWPRRPRDQAPRRTRDVPRHLERPRQPHLRGGDPRAAKGGRVVPQQDSGKVSTYNNKGDLFS